MAPAYSANASVTMGFTLLLALKNLLLWDMILQQQ
jgi:hypothetical protein